MTEITDVDTGQAAEAAEIDHTTCSRCATERLEGVPFCTRCNLRFEVAAPTYQPVRRGHGLPSRKLLLVLPLLLVAVATALLLLFG